MRLVVFFFAVAISLGLYATGGGDPPSKTAKPSVVTPVAAAEPTMVIGTYAVSDPHEPGSHVAIVADYRTGLDLAQREHKTLIVLVGDQADQLAKDIDAAQDDVIVTLGDSAKFGLPGIYRYEWQGGQLLSASKPLISKAAK